MTELCKSDHEYRMDWDKKSKQFVFTCRKCGISESLANVRSKSSDKTAGLCKIFIDPNEHQKNAGYGQGDTADKAGNEGFI